MRKTIKTILLIAAMGGLTTATYAQTIVVAGDNFDADPLGGYGQVAYDFGPPAGFSPQISISTDNPEGTNTQNCAITFNCVAGETLNFGLETAQLTCTNNTNINLYAYILEFDLAVQGVSIPAIGGYQPGATIGLFANGADIYYPPGGGTAETNLPASQFPAAGTGYKHYSIPVSQMIAWAEPLLVPTNATIAFAMGFYMGGITNNSTDTSTNGVEEIDIANLQLLLITNAAPPPRPVMTVLHAKPGLRVFAQSAGALTDQEGFGTVDVNQSWVGATTYPVTYSVTFQDFKVVNGSQFYTQMVGAYSAGVNPYIAYAQPNCFTWTITAEEPDFIWSIDWKTNSINTGVVPNTGNPNVFNVATGTNTTAGGVGTWTLAFDSDTNGTVTGPDGIPAHFTLPSEAWANGYFADPLTICFGETPGSAAGEGQFFDISKIAIMNVAGTNEVDDFTTDTNFDTTLWNPAFSVTSTNAVVLASINTPYWVNWTTPALNYGLETKANLTDPTWYQPTYWNGTPLLIPPTQMGPGMIWTLVPNTCLPTADGGTNEGVAGNAKTGFFTVKNPPTAQ